MDQNMLSTTLWTVALIGLVYFLMIRPNNKQQKEKKLMVDNLKPKDNVILTSGIHGAITKVNGDTIMLKVSTSSEIEVDKNAVKSVTNRDYKADIAKEND